MLLPLLLLVPACGDLPPADPLPPGSFAFGVFGDGPYRVWEYGRFHAMIEDASRTEMRWLIHIGDILWYPCSDERFAAQRDAMNEIAHPVVYTPGDNEWTDCHERIAGSYRPLDRLERLRATFFADPGTSLGAEALPVESQGVEHADLAEFIENRRWSYGGFVFVTIHIVGSGNAMKGFAGRTAADDAESERRTRAALEWVNEAFDTAAARSMRGVVIAMHADPGMEDGSGAWPGYHELVELFAERTRGFDGQVLLIHGDTHTYRVDHPLRDRMPAGDTLFNFTRLETFGSPDIGWVRVVVDTVAGRFIRFEPRVMRGRRLF
jgi:hypothetical protein